MLHDFRKEWIDMNEYGRFSDLRVSEREIAFLSSLVPRLAQEWNPGGESGPQSDTAIALLTAYRGLCCSAQAWILELLEDTLNDTVGKWLYYNLARPGDMVKQYFLQNVAAGLPGLLEKLFARLSKQTVNLLDSRIQRELSDNGLTLLQYNYLDMKDFQLKWSNDFVTLAAESVMERLDTLPLDSLLPPGCSDARRAEIMAAEGVKLAARMTYEVKKVKEMIDSHYRTGDAFCEFSDEVNLSLWVWLERVKEYAGS